MDTEQQERAQPAPRFFVDRLFIWTAPAKGRQARRHFGNGKKSCHLWTDGTDDDLVAFARDQLRLDPVWLQTEHERLHHFDLTEGKHWLARRRGAELASLTAWLRDRTIELVDDDGLVLSCSPEQDAP